MPSRPALPLLGALLWALPLAAQHVTVTVLPARPLIERSACCLLLNFDFELGVDRDTLELDEITATLVDASGHVLGIRRVDRNGMVPSIATLNARPVVPDRVSTIFNPFYSIGRQTPVASLRYTFRLHGREGTVQAAAVVTPTLYETKTDLILPLEGRILVRDGHDFYSHHRRMDMSVLRELGLAKRQFNRYAYDLSIADSAGRLYRTDGRTNADWLGYGATVIAPGAGVVAEVQNDEPEHVLPESSFDEMAAVKHPKTIPGNFVIINHGNGECSFMAHLKQGSVRVKAGDRVKQGQPIGLMGLSGDSFWLPHVHYQLMDNCDFQDAEGLPSYFSGFVRAGAATSMPEHRGQIDTGDLVTTLPVKH